MTLRLINWWVIFTISNNMDSQNSSYLGDDGLIYCFWAGDQSSQTVNKLRGELSSMTKKLRQQGKEVLILADITSLGKCSLASRYSGVSLLKSLDYDKAAIIGNYFLFRGIVEPVFLAAGQLFKMKLFDDLSEAKSWLTINSSKNQQHPMTI